MKMYGETGEITKLFSKSTLWEKALCLFSYKYKPIYTYTASYNALSLILNNRYMGTRLKKYTFLVFCLYQNTKFLGMRYTITRGERV